MARHEPQRNTDTDGSPVHAANTTRRRRIPKYKKVLDARDNPIRELWVHNHRCYARITVQDDATGKRRVRRIPLSKEVSTAAQAQAELRRLLTPRDDNKLPVSKRAPKFCEYADQYIAYFQMAKDAKRPRTIRTKQGYLKVAETTANIPFAAGVDVTEILLSDSRFRIMPEARIFAGCRRD